VRSTSAIESRARGAYVPAEFIHDVDVAECALDEQLEHLHRQHAAASRAAAETHCARLMRAIDALEERLVRPEND
jgi:hypothetical protein